MDIFQKLREHILKLQPDKCEFLRREVMYLGHCKSENGVKPDPGKVKSVVNYSNQTNQKEISAFLGLSGYYRRFIQNYSKSTIPLTFLKKYCF